MTTAQRIISVDGVAAMGNIAQGETVALNLCHACRVEVRKGDRFCRRCGAHQSGWLASSSRRMNWTEWPMCIEATSEVPSLLTHGDLCHPVSGPLVTTVTASVSANASA
jgi:hypothetical protein